MKNNGGKMNDETANLAEHIGRPAFAAPPLIKQYAKRNRTHLHINKLRTNYIYKFNDG